MSEKRNNKYRLKIEELERKDGAEPGHEITFEIENHDDIFALLERTKNNGRFENPGDNTEFLIGLKLFSEVLLRNRSNPLFEEFGPAFSQFMKKVKGK